MPQFTLELNEVYFFTATILNWKNLLASDRYKQIILESLLFLSQKKKIAIYGFVIMPNHIHLIWEMLDKNGQELPYASFMKFTAHQFRKDLLKNDLAYLAEFEKPKIDRNHQFWLRNSLPVHLYNPKVVEQKLDYIHHNPVSGKWNLSDNYVDYPYSSAKFYEEEIDSFGFLVHYKERF